MDDDDEPYIHAADLSNYAESQSEMIAALAWANEMEGFPYRCYCHEVVSMAHPHARCWDGLEMVPVSIFEHARSVLIHGRSDPRFANLVDSIEAGELE